MARDSQGSSVGLVPTLGDDLLYQCLRVIQEAERAIESVLQHRSISEQYNLNLYIVLACTPSHHNSRPIPQNSCNQGFQNRSAYLHYDSLLQRCPLDRSPFKELFSLDPSIDERTTRPQIFLTK